MTAPTIIQGMAKMIEKHFVNWDSSAVQELEKMCRNMPVLPSERARAFFNQVSRATKSDSKVAERVSGKLFDGIAGLVGTSDRKDFSARYEDGNPRRFDHGIMIVETCDKSIIVTFCLARISYKDFLVCGWMGEDKRQAVKAILSKPCRATMKKWWEFWK